ncbi:MAG: exonuclease SbcCD subunit D C-terminal domain-containing protein [Bacteroidota bacterium]
MKILHTSDWHLGQKFLHHSRQEEHQRVLDWLLQCIQTHKVDALLVSGDIFDIGNPPNYARTLYYEFLRKLLQTCCRHVVITGGNHDSPAMLNAPRELLATMNIHVVGCAQSSIDDEIIELRDHNGQLEAVVAAVPFLRDKDLRFSYAGESGEQRTQRLRAGLLQHFKMAGTQVQLYENQQVPLLAMGHLYVKGAYASSKQDNIYIGDKENISAADFPSTFHYVALGHIHRAQQIGDLAHIRYSGSPIPLSFSETKDDKSVYLLHFEAQELTQIEPLPIPTFRRLKTISGKLPYVKSRLQQLASDYADHLPTWVEVIISTDRLIPNLDQQLYDYTANMPLELLKIRVQRPLDTTAPAEVIRKLDDLSPLEVFQQKCVAHYDGQPPAEMEELEMTFRLLLEQLGQNED